MNPFLESAVTHVVFSQHICDGRGKTNTREWADVDKEGTHPVAYVARGSHANYFDLGDDGRHLFSPWKRCTALDFTLKERRLLPTVVLVDCVAPADGEEWLLFKGGWGEGSKAHGPCRD